MLKAIKNVLFTGTDVASHPVAEYEPIQGDEDEQRPLNTHRVSAQGLGEDQAVYWSFWALGAGVLLSWNVLICSFPLFASFFPESSPIKSSLASWLSTVFSFGNLIILGVAQRDVGKSSPSPRLHFALVLLLVVTVLVAFPILSFVLPSLSQGSRLLFPVFLLVTIALSVSTAYLQSAVFALAALWGTPTTIAVMSGQGGIAVLVSAVQLLLAVFSALGSSSTSVETPSLRAGVALWFLGAIGSLSCIFAHRYLTRHPDYTKVLQPILVRAEQGGIDDGSNGSSMEVSKRIFRKNILLEIAVAWVFVVTLSVFPPITSRILSTRASPPQLFQPAVFIPVHFVLFNIGDYIGRTYLPAVPALLPTSHSRVLLLSMCRTVFIPVFLLCNVTPRQTDSAPIINSDIAFFLIMLVFGMSNGWISSMSMILASSPALNARISDEEKDVAGTLAAFCLVAGLAAGSASSFAVNRLVE